MINQINFFLFFFRILVVIIRISRGIKIIRVFNFLIRVFVDQFYLREIGNKREFGDNFSCHNFIFSWLLLWYFTLWFRYYQVFMWIAWEFIDLCQLFFVVIHVGCTVYLVLYVKVLGRFWWYFRLFYKKCIQRLLNRIGLGLDSSLAI